MSTQHYSGWNILPMPQGQAFFLVSQLSTSLYLGLCCTLLWAVMEGLEIESGFQLSLLYCWLKKNIEEFSLQMDFLVLLSSVRYKWVPWQSGIAILLKIWLRISGRYWDLLCNVNSHSKFHCKQSLCQGVCNCQESDCVVNIVDFMDILVWGNVIIIEHFLWDFCSP